MIPSKFKPFLVGAGILLFGIVGLVVLTALRPEPQRVEPEDVVPAVAVVLPEVKSDPLPVQGNGAVRAVRQVTLVAEVGGRVTSVARAFESGRAIRSGQVLVQIDTTDYRNAYEIAQAEVVQRRFDAILADEESSIAREEFGRLSRRTAEDRKEGDTELGNLVYKEPQQALAHAALRAARARLADASKRLERTQVRAPFSGRVLNAQVDAGQFVGAGTVLGVVYASDEVEITVPLQAGDAALIPALWSSEGGNGGIEARVSVDYGSQRHRWTGYVDRIEGAIDAATRTVGVVVRVPNPERPSTPGGPPLLVGSFASVSILGPVEEAYVAIPEEALREGDLVWVESQGKLSIRPVAVLHRTDGFVLISEGIEAGDRIITSNLLVVTEGMAVRSSLAS